jgi:oligopeptidase B
MEKLNENNPLPPRARKEKHIIRIHGDERNDPYFWLRLSDAQKMASEADEQTQKVLDYLHAENKYLDDTLQSTKELQEDLYEEMVGRIKKDDSSVPYFENGFHYKVKYEKQKEHPIYTRVKELDSAQEILLLDVNVLAEGHSYFQVSGLQVSPNNEMLAFGQDDQGRRQYTLRFKYIANGEFLEDEIPNTNGLAVWANDNRSIFYSVKDETLRSYKIFRHVLGSPLSEDQEIYHEKDARFRTFVFKSKSKSFIIIGSAATESNEYRYLSADDPHGSFTLFQKRQDKIEYGIAHHEDKWFIKTNLDAENFKIMQCPLDRTAMIHWTDFIPHREKVLVEGMDIFSEYFVLSERIDGVSQLRIIDRTRHEEHYIKTPEAAHLIYTGKNPEFNTETLRFHYTSLLTPNSVFDYNMRKRTKKLRKIQEVVGGYDSGDYRSERLMAPSEEGIKVPISLVYHKDTQIDGSAPLLLYGYGSYGISLDPYFSSIRLSLLDRGFIFAIAHIRGGEELGRSWYKDGKMLKKKNTFIDFIHCAEFLLKNDYCHTDKLYAMGGSAGGLLMGAVMNMRPDLWKGIIAVVPFVDVVTTMLDESIPLTTGEFSEWGNPKEEKYYHYIKSYSPYDNVEAKDYPALLVTTGYHDSQVQYWEPAKWVAKLRDLKTDDEPLLLNCDMDTGHGGAAGRFKQLRETALEYAFLLWINGDVT